MSSTNRSRMDELVSQGLEASHADDAATAIEYFSQACMAAPEVGLPQLLLGAELASLGHMERAEAALATAVLLSPDLYIARYQLGLLQFSGHRVPLALVTWEPLLMLPATHALTHFVRGFRSLAAERNEAALAHFESGLACNVDNASLSADIRKVMARVEATIAHGDAQTLLANYRHEGRLH